MNFKYWSPRLYHNLLISILSFQIKHSSPRWSFGNIYVFVYNLFYIMVFDTTGRAYIYNAVVVAMDTPVDMH